VILFGSLLGLAGFFLLRPAVAGSGYYRPRPNGNGYAYWYLTAAAFVPYAFALRSASRGVAPQARTLLMGSVVLFVAFLPAPAQQSQDVYQYLLYGKMALHGFNPYVISAAHLHDAWKVYTLWDNTLSVYGPLWTSVCAGVVWISGGNLTVAFLLMKVVTAGLGITTAAVVARATEVPSAAAGGLRVRPEFVILAFAYNPMVLVAAGMGANVDVAVGAALAGALLAERSRRPAITTFLLTMAVLIKAYAVLLLLAWLVSIGKRRGVGSAFAHAAGAGVLVLGGYAPFWDGPRTFSGLADATRRTSLSLTGSLMRWRSGGNAFTSSAGATGAAIRVLAGLAIAGAVFAVVRSGRTRDQPWRAGALLFAVYTLVTPWFEPWYLIELVTLAAVVADDALTWGVLTFSATSLVVMTGGVPAGILVQTLVRYGPPLLVAWSFARRRRPVFSAVSRATL